MQIKHRNQNLDNAKNILVDLINFNTTSSFEANTARNTTEATEYVGNFLQNKTGAEIHYGEAYEYPEGSGKMHKSMIAVWNPKKQSNNPPLAFSSHIDVVTPQPEFASQAFNATADGDKIVGRGAIDMKGAIASFMASMQAMKESGQLENIDRPIIYALSSNEEVGLMGARDICTLIKQHNIEPSEFVITEPTDGYVGTGCKGTIQNKIDFSIDPSILTEKRNDSWTQYCTVKIKSKGGHSSLQGASPADTALVTTDVLKLVKRMREGGIPIEICDVSYGIANNVIGGEANITIGYDIPPAHNQNINELLDIPKALRDNLQYQKVTNSNAILKTLNIVSNTLNKAKNEVSGMDFGKISIEVSQNQFKKKIKTYPETLSRDENGKLQSNSAIERAIETTEGIYQIHAEQRGGGKPEGYILPLMGVTKLGVPIINGNANNASISYDIRYPHEATVENDRNIEHIDSVLQKVTNCAYSDNRFITKVTELAKIIPYSVAQNDKELAQYQKIARNTGFARYKSTKTHMPYTCDGNLISSEFPQASTIIVSSGGFSNLAHGDGEHITNQQISDNIKLYSAIVTEKANAIDQTTINSRA